MTIRRFVVLAAMLVSTGAAAGAAGPFDAPVRDCHPCRFWPGAGQPQFDLTFVFTGSGDDKKLAALDIAPAGGGAHQRLDTGGIAVSDFSDGFTIETYDLNGDGLGDLSITTGEYAAGNSSAKYWIYDPAAHRFVPLERSGGGDADSDDSALVPMEKGVLYCHVHDTAVAYADYVYRISGNRAVAVRKEEQSQDDAFIVQTTTNLTTKPPRVVRHVTVGYAGDSPARTPSSNVSTTRGAMLPPCIRRAMPRKQPRPWKPPSAASSSRWRWEAIRFRATIRRT